MKFGDYEVSGTQQPGYGESFRGSPAQAQHVCWRAFLPSQETPDPSSALFFEALLRHRRIAVLALFDSPFATCIRDGHCGLRKGLCSMCSSLALFCDDVIIGIVDHACLLRLS